MTIDQAMKELKQILGRGLYPTAVPKVRRILEKVKDGGTHEKS